MHDRRFSRTIPATAQGGGRFRPGEVLETHSKGTKRETIRHVRGGGYNRNLHAAGSAIGGSLLAAALSAAVWAVPAAAEAAWFESPTVKATVSPRLSGTDPHYINLSEDGAFLLVDWHSSNTAFPVQLYSVAELKALSGATNRVAMSSALAGDFYGAGTGDGGWKGGAVSSALGLAIPGSGKSSGAVYTAFSVPAFGWKKDENAFEVSGLDGAGFDGLDFNAAGTRLYVNQYASGSRNKILAYDTSALKSGHSLSLLSTKTVDGVSRIRNLSCYTVKGRDLVYFGEGAVSGSNNSVYVYDPADGTVTALVTDAALFDDDIMNVKLSNVASGCPTLYVQTDNGRLHVFLLAPDGKSVTSATPVRSLTPAESATLCGLTGTPASGYVKFRNFEVTDDGETAFFAFLSGGASGVTSPGLSVVGSGYTGDAYVSSPNKTSVLFTDCFFTANSRIEVDFEFTDGGNGFVFSPWERSNYFCGLWRDGGTYKYFAGNQWNLVGPTKKTADVNVRHQTVLDAKNKVAYLVTDGVQEDFDLSACSFGAVAWPIMFLGAATSDDGGVNRRVNTTHYARAKIYSAKIYENDVLVRDYVPAIVNGVPGLYDRMNGSVAIDTREGFAHPGFGGDVLRVSGEPYVELSKTDAQASTKGISTGYRMNGASRVELDCYVASDTPADSRPMGSWNKESSFKNLVYVHNQMVEAFLNAYHGIHVYTGVNVAGQRQTFVFDAPAAQTLIMRDGIVQTVANASVAPAADLVADYPLGLFGDCNNADCTAFQGAASGMKAYSMTIKENGATVTNFVPFLAIEGACLKDEITGEFIKPGAPKYFFYRVAATPDANEGYIVKTTGDRASGIMTGWYLNTQSKFEYDFTLGSTANSQRLAGSWHAGGAMRTLFWTTGGKFKFFVNSGGGDFTSDDATDTKRHLFFIDYTTEGTPTGGYYTDGVLTKSAPGTAISSATAATTCPLSLFADNNGSAFQESCYTGARLWSAKAYEGGGLIHEWVPAATNGVVGLADKCTGLFTPADTANFDGAGDLWTPTTGNAYIETTGGTVIDTGYKPNKATRIEVDMLPLRADGCYFGNYGASNPEAYTLWCQSGHVEAMMKNGNVNSSVFFFPRSNSRFTGVLDFVSQTGYVVIGGVKPAAYVADLSSKSFAADWVSRNNLGVCGSLKTDDELCTSPAPASMRCYAVRIYENDALVHLFLPYSGEDGVGLRDALTGEKAFKHPASTGADPVYVAGPAAVTAAEIAALETTAPDDFNLSRDVVKNVSAFSAGASAYRWTRNGTVVGETDGSLGIGWRSGAASDDFSVTPIYRDAEGNETLGAASSFTVTYNPSAFVIVVR